MSAQHTPGPLTTRVSKEGDVAVMQGGNVVAECFASIRHMDEDARPEALANATLYAAAPDLLAELQAAHKLLLLALKHMDERRTSLFAEESERLGLGADGATRYHERAAVISRATGGSA